MHKKYTCTEIRLPELVPGLPVLVSMALDTVPDRLLFWNMVDTVITVNISNLPTCELVHVCYSNAC